jgi:hypothetical protein
MAPPPATWTAAKLDELYAILCEAAENEEKCPTDAQIGKAFGIDKGTVYYGVGCLIKKGRITKQSNGKYRSITIVESGLSTAWHDKAGTPAQTPLSERMIEFIGPRECPLQLWDDEREHEDDPRAARPPLQRMLMSGVVVSM